MSNANKSDLNKGWLAVPAQFQQVITKYYGKMISDELTTAEKVRLFTFPSAIFGSTGTIFGDQIVQTVSNIVGFDWKTASPEQVHLFRSGVLGWMLSEGADLNTDFSSRMSLGSDFTKQLFDTVSQGGAPMLSGALGPSGEPLKRWVNGVRLIGETVDLTTLENDEPVTMEQAKLMASVFMDASLGILSSTKNANTYLSYLLQDSKSFRKDGALIFENASINDLTAFFGILGIQAREVNDFYELRKLSEDHVKGKATFLTTDANLITKIMDSVVISGKTPESVAAGQALVRAILNKYGSRDGTKLLDQVYDLQSKALLEGGSLMMKVLKDAQDDAEKGLGVLTTTNKPNMVLTNEIEKRGGFPE